MHLKNGINGFVVPAGDVAALAEKLKLLLDNDQLRAGMSHAARQTIELEASIESMALGFLEALDFVGRNRAALPSGKP
jgi:glycosyltransferase involved in cell wall biosynthesis